jgi:hypothetical protein
VVREIKILGEILPPSLSVHLRYMRREGRRVGNMRNEWRKGIELCGRQSSRQQLPK